MSEDSLPPEYALRKKGKAIVFFDKFHESHRESRLRRYHRLKWYHEHPQAKETKVL
jgi:hypothetical protein